jgi:hypothetical protein
MSTIQGSGATEIAEALKGRQPAKADQTAKPETQEAAKDAPALADSGAVDKGAGEGDRVKTLEQRLAQLEAKAGETTKRREAEDAMTDFLRSGENENIPMGLLKKYVTPSTNKDAMRKQVAEVNQHLQSFIKNEVARGRLRWVDIGSGGGGGNAPAANMASGTAYQNISNGLRERKTGQSPRQSSGE